MAYYFKHDDNARRDPKLIKLRRVKGMKGIGIYWCLIEILHEQGGEITFDEVNSISFELQEDEANVLSVIKEFDLFIMQAHCISNARVLQSLGERKDISKKAKVAAKARWDKYFAENQQVNASALHPHSKRNAIIEEKRIEENIKECLNSSVWIENICMKSKINKDKIGEWILKFKTHIISTGENHNNLTDFKRHFSNWIVKQDFGIKKMVY